MSATRLVTWCLLATLFTASTRGQDLQEDELLNDTTREDILRLNFPGWELNATPVDTDAEAHERHSRSARAGSAHLWPNAIIPYAIANGTNLIDETHQAVISRALAYIEATTCIKFVRISQKAFLKSPGGKLAILKGGGSGCQGDIGMVVGGKPSVIVYGNGCMHVRGSNSVAHELMHVLGLYHEHTRPDREEYVKVLKRNIDPKFLENFRKVTVMNTLNTEYDYSSAMHYGATTYRNRRLPPGTKTINVLTPDAKIGQRNAPSVMDLFRLNSLYKCHDRFGDMFAGLGNEHSCLGCIDHLLVIAKTGSGAGARSSGSSLTLSLIVNDTSVFRTESHELTNHHRRLLDTGVTSMWRVHLRQRCVTPGQIKMVALRAKFYDDWTADSVEILAKAGDTTIQLGSLGSSPKRLTVFAGEAEAQQVAVPTAQPDCTSCRDDCLATVSLAVKFNTAIVVTEPFALLLQVSSGRSVFWRRISALPSSNSAVRSHVHTFRFSLERAAGEVCFKGNSVRMLAVAQPVGGTFSAMQRGIENIVVTASLQGSTSFVLASLHYNKEEQTRARRMIIARAQTCAGRCHGC